MTLSQKRSLSHGMLPAGLLALVAVGALWPLGWGCWRVVVGVVEAPRSQLADLIGVSPVLVLRTLGWAALIAVLATLLGSPIALCIRRWGWSVAGPALAALAVPTYLAYSGWGMARAPRTFLGDRIELLAQAGAKWLPTAVGTGLAVAGMAFWCAPLAAIVLAAGWSRIEPSVLDSWRCEPAPNFGARLARMGVLVRLGAPAVLACAGLVVLITVGSAVPLHLANVQTISIRAWLQLTQSGAGDQWRAVVACWPVIAAGVAAGWLVSGRVLRSRATGYAADGAAGGGGGVVGGGAAGGRRPSWVSVVLAVVVALLAVGVPLGLFVEGLPGKRLFLASWRTSRDALYGSAGVSLGVGVVAAVLVASAAALPRGGWAARAGAVCVRLFVVGAFLPGIVVGWATSDAWNAWGPLRGIADSAVVLVAAHVARYGALAVLAGVWLARMEPREEASLRAIDGATGLRGWVLACLPSQWGAVVGVALGVAALSFHEIEASIFVQPTGVTSFSRQMLDHLHFFRTTELCSAGVVIVGFSLVLAAGASVGLAWAARQRGSRRRTR